MIMINPHPKLSKYFYKSRKIFGTHKQSMSVILILLIASISVAGLFLAAFLWGVRSGQFEDDYSPASRILFDDKPVTKTKTQSK